MVADKEKWFSIMIVPEDGTGMRRWRVTHRRYFWLKVAFGATCFSLFVGFISMSLLGIMYSKVRHYKKVNEQLLVSSSKLDSIAARLDRYEQKERKLRSILGSDLELSKPIIVKSETSKLQSPFDQDKTGLNELEQSIADQVAKIRRLPTMWPVDAWQITKEFIITGNPREDHYGIDILALNKSSVVAAADGKVTFAAKDSKLGLLIVIDHGNGWDTKYGHNATLLKQYGDIVRKGEQIAIFGGSDGSSTGAHLHFGMFYKGQPKNPLDYLDKKKINISTLID